MLSTEYVIMGDCIIGFNLLILIFKKSTARFVLTPEWSTRFDEPVHNVSTNFISYRFGQDSGI